MLRLWPSKKYKNIFLHAPPLPRPHRECVAKEPDITKGPSTGEFSIRDDSHAGTSSSWYLLIYLLLFAWFRLGIRCNENLDLNSLSGSHSTPNQRLKLFLFYSLQLETIPIRDEIHLGCRVK